MTCKLPTMAEWGPVHCKVKAFPPCRLRCPLTPQCPEWVPFDRGPYDGADAWILVDMAAGEVPNSMCGACGKEFPGRNIALEQGASLIILYWSDKHEDGSFDWADCITVAPEEVEVVL